MIKECYIFCFLAVAVIFVYFSVLGFDFQWSWDDNWMVMNPFTIAGFNWDNMKMVFYHYYIAQYGPINELVYMAIYVGFGYNPTAYHLYPLLLHIVNSCLVFILIKRLIAGRTPAKTACWIAFVTALLFAIHPMQVESIAWIAASKIPLYSLFVLLSLLTYSRYVQCKRKRYYIEALFFFVCAFGSKEQSIVLPATLLLIDWLLGRSLLRCGENNVNQTEVRTLQFLLLEKLPFILFAVFGGILTYINQSSDVIDDWAGYPLGQRLIFFSYSIVEYLGKLAIPINLLYLYPFPMTPGLPMPTKFWIYPAVLVISVLILSYLLKRKHWPVIFGLLFFLINMILMLHLVAMSRFTIMADRYVYLGSIGIFFVIAWYIVPCLQKLVSNGHKWFLAVPIAYMIYLAGYAHYYTYSWRDSTTLKKEFEELVDPILLKKIKENNANQ